MSDELMDKDDHISDGPTQYVQSIHSSLITHHSSLITKEACHLRQIGDTLAIFKPELVLKGGYSMELIKKCIYVCLCVATLLTADAQIPHITINVPMRDGTQLPTDIYLSDRGPATFHVS